MDTLTAAGYEAYNVTADNYSTLEDDLQTDFASMGLDPIGSYIVVISGEESDNASSTYAYGDNLVTPTPDPGGQGVRTEFTYTYEGVTYSMRYLTVTYHTQSNLGQHFSYTLTSEQFPTTWEKIIDASFWYCVDAATAPLPFSSIISLLTDINTDDNFQLLDEDQLTVLGRSEWTVRYLQIWDDSSSTWVSAQYSDYAVTTAYCAGFVYNATTKNYEQYVGVEDSFIVYSEYYFDYETCKLDAIEARKYGLVWPDNTEAIDFYLMSSSGDVNYCGSGKALFSIPHWSDY